MRLHILSDLHLEFADFAVQDVKPDVVILAGDIDVKARGVSWAARTFPDIPVLYVPGNHEYYGGAIPRLTEKMREQAKGTNVRVLDGDTTIINGVTFLGATLWTDFELEGNIARSTSAAAAGMTDYRRIRVSPRFRRLRPVDTIGWHHGYLRRFRDSLSAAVHPVVVITHHAPSPQSLHRSWEGDPLNPAYASDLRAFVEGSKATLWVHGHIHCFSDYQIGRTRVLCNPRGYPDEPGIGFRKDFVVDLGEE